MGREGDGGTGSDGGVVREQRGGWVGEGGGSLGEGKREEGVEVHDVGGRRRGRGGSGGAAEEVALLRPQPWPQQRATCQ